MTEDDDVPSGDDPMLMENAALTTMRIDQDVVEMPLLLPRWQAEALEAAAKRRGMTTGQMLRRVIAEMLTPNEAKR
jgi:hypothetical protein